ncbi:hypothetical protein GCM10009547_42360 [Sporichthya brevicatena]|uniref:Putative zinc-finger domain-containing protein n=1 Tax=Sporichthya brevicatena TaxID=171442 RepID=A0ABN1H9I2_9ACTN
MPTDTALIAAARRGDIDAFDSLTDRHREAALRFVRRTSHGSDHLVDAAITATRADLLTGSGPTTAFRAHLLDAVRREQGGMRRGRRKGVEGETGPFPAACVATTAKAFAGLSEEAQAALWHTEVEGEPLLETGKLLGLDATGVAELSFAARDTLRAAQLLEHRAAISSPDCRWTTNRLGGYARNTLSAEDHTKVSEHLDGCDLCAGVAPAVIAVESDLALLVATVVLGSAAEAYLDREGAGIARAGGFAGLMRDAARPVAVAISAIALITAGLLGTLAFADEDTAKREVATPSTFTAIPVAPTNPISDDGPSSGEGSSGREDVRPTPRPKARTEARSVVRTERVTTVEVSDVKSDPVRPVVEDETEDDGLSLNLGVTKLNINPGAGLLGLPGISLG